MFTNYFIKRKVQILAVKSANRPHHYVSLNEAHTLLVLYNEEDRNAVMAVLEPLRKAQKEIYSCVFISSSVSDVIADEASIPVNPKKDLNAWGFPSEMLINKTVGIKADILIDVSRPGCYALQYIALKHPCSFKVGLKYEGQEWYDLALAMTDRNDIQYLLEQILFYLRSVSPSNTITVSSI